MLEKKNMSGIQKEAAARSIICCLFECGYIDIKKARELMYILDTGDRKVFEEIRGYLFKLIKEINK